MRMKRNRKNTGSRELKNLQPSPIKDKDEDEDGDDFRNMESPYRDLPENYVYPEKDGIDGREEYRLQILECSQVALDYYNQKSRTKYELVEPSASMLVFSFYPIWGHLNFTAKPKSAPNDGDGNGNSSTKLFFGEVCVSLLQGEWVAKKCFILKGKSAGRCDFCEAENMPIKHPTRGFRMQQKFKPYALRGYTVG